MVRKRQKRRCTFVQRGRNSCRQAAEHEALMAALGHKNIKRQPTGLTKEDLADVCRREDADGEERDVDRVSGLGSSSVGSKKMVLSQKEKEAAKIGLSVFTKVVQNPQQQRRLRVLKKEMSNSGTTAKRKEREEEQEGQKEKEEEAKKDSSSSESDDDRKRHRKDHHHHNPSYHSQSGARPHDSHSRGGQRPSESPPTPIIDNSGMTQTPLMGGLLSPVTLSATRQPLLVTHKATGGATTQTRTTNVLLPPPPPPQFKRRITGTDRSTAA
ncbi:hypothetical protein F7725_011349 [Dissostichus mawsoni]|uniref:Uncharacterized protein n=1 Tax=Dissostichus mawsoni TaxID=36200 RepID=A0A7J5ZCR5_DISMA|nr:hypothetical protein F7725_011349 [Dissostichus mawsoni]